MALFLPNDRRSMSTLFGFIKGRGGVGGSERHRDLTNTLWLSSKLVGMCLKRGHYGLSWFVISMLKVSLERALMPHSSPSFQRFRGLLTQRNSARLAYWIVFTKLLLRFLLTGLRLCWRRFSKSQNAFMWGKQILDHVLIAFGCLDSVIKFGESKCTLQDGLRKAYDHVNWDFLLYMLRMSG
jgi:hypothetical protein